MLRVALIGSSALALALAAPAASAQGGPPPPPPFPQVQAPAGNAITTAKALLGKALFWDEQLSSTRTTACGTCHIPSAGGSDPRALIGLTDHPGLDGVFGTDDDVTGSVGVIQSGADGRYVSEPDFHLWML